MDGIGDAFSTLVIVKKLFLSSLTFALIKYFLIIYVLVLLFDLALLIKQRPFGGDLRDTVLGINVPPEMITKKGKLIAKWNKVKARMKSGNQSDYKVAIIEGDNIIDDLITRMGYAGENFGDRLNNINPGQIGNIDDLRIAHEVRNRIIHDENFILTEEEAKKTIDQFEEFLRYFQIIE